MATTPRGQVQTQGASPLADVSSGAAGTVLGTERAKLQALQDVRSLAANLVLTGTQLDVRMATAVVSGLMSAADFAKLAGIQAGAQVNPAYSSANNALYLVQRDSNGDFAARIITATTFSGALSGNATTATTATSATSATTAAACSGNAATATALSAGADRTKLDSINTGGGVTNGWTRNYLPSGKRHYTMQPLNSSLPGTSAAVLFGPFTLPDGLAWSQVSVQATLLGDATSAPHQVIIGLRQPTGTTISVVAQTYDGLALAGKGGGSAALYCNLTATEL